MKQPAMEIETVRMDAILVGSSDHTMSVAENILHREFTATAPKQKWAADITYLNTGVGWLCLAVVMGLFPQRIVG